MRSSWNRPNYQNYHQIIIEVLWS